MRTKDNSSDLVTKGYLDFRLGQFERKMEDTFDEKLRAFKNEIMTILDKVMGELATIRQEISIAFHQTSEIREQVENHEERITNLEKTHAGI